MRYAIGMLVMAGTTTAMMCVDRDAVSAFGRWSLVMLWLSGVMLSGYDCFIADKCQENKETFGSGSCSATPEPQRYPCEAFSLGFWMSMDFPEGVDNLCSNGEEATHAALAPHIARLDHSLRERLAALGVSGYGPPNPKYVSGFSDNGGVSLAFCFPPMDIPGDEKHDEQAKRYYRAMTVQELADYIAENNCEPYPDEYWIATHWSGINVFRVARYA